MNSIRKYKNTIQNMLFVFLLLPFYPLNAIKNSNASIYRVYILAIVMISFFMMIIKFTLSNGKVKKCILFLALFMGWLGLSCVYNGLSPVSAFYYAGQLLAFFIIHDYYMSGSKETAITFLKIERNLLSIIILINLFFQIVNQDAFGHNNISKNYYNFFVSDNYLGYYYISYIALCIFLDYISCKKIKIFSIIMTFAVTASLVYAWAAKAIIGLIFVYVYILLLYKKKFVERLINFKILIILYVVIFLAVVVFNAQEVFGNLIQTLLNKDASLSGRTYIWAATLDKIKESIIWGYGVDSDGTRVIVQTAYGQFHATHNLVYEILLQSGLPGLIFYLSFLYKALTSNKKYQDDDSYKMLLYFCFIIFVMYLASHTIYILGSYIIVAICANYKTFKEGYSNESDYFY